MRLLIFNVKEKERKLRSGHAYIFTIHVMDVMLSTRTPLCVYMFWLCCVNINAILHQ